MAITNNTLIKRTEELGKSYIKIGLYFKNLSSTFKHQEFKENKEFKSLVINRLSLVKEFMSKIKDLRD